MRRTTEATHIVAALLIALSFGLMLTACSQPRVSDDQGPDPANVVLPESSNVTGSIDGVMVGVAGEGQDGYWHSIILEAPVKAGSSEIGKAEIFYDSKTAFTYNGQPERPDLESLTGRQPKVHAEYKHGSGKNAWRPMATRIDLAWTP
ncbi:MAG TPA: hypothetical protein VGM51_01865 [Armatimonadota bacterium]